MKLSYVIRWRLGLLCHFALVAALFLGLSWGATHPAFVLGSERFAKLPAEWEPSPPMIMVSLAGVALMAFAPWRPVLGLMVFVAVGYGFPRRGSFEFFCRWHVLEAIAILAVSAMLLWKARVKSLDTAAGSDPRRIAGEVERRPSPLLLIMGGLVGWVLLTSSIAWAGGNYQPAYNHHPVHMIDGLLLMIVAANCLRSSVSWWWLSMTVAVTLCLRTGLAPQYLRLNGDLGILLSMGVTLAALATMAVRHWLPQMFALAAIGIQVWALYKTENRGGAVALAAATTMTWLACRRKMRVLAIAVPMLFLVGNLFVQTGYWNRIESIWAGGPGRASVDSRFLIYEAGWKMALDNPIFGVGLGNFEPRMAAYSRNGKSDSPHNHVIAMLAETGFLGAVLFLTLFVYAMVVAFVTARRLPPGPEHWTAALLAGALVAYFVGGMFMTRHTFWLAYLLVGGAAAMSSRVERFTEGSTLPFPPNRDGS